MGTSSVQLKMSTPNKFIGLGALYGGAIYCENPLAVILSTNDVFEDNVALKGGAINKNSIRKMRIENIFIILK